MSITPLDDFCLMTTYSRDSALEYLQRDLFGDLLLGFRYKNKVILQSRTQTRDSRRYLDSNTEARSGMHSAPHPHALLESAVGEAINGCARRS